MAGRKEVGAKRISVSQGFLMFLFSWFLLLGYSETGSAQEGTAEVVRKPVLLEDVAATVAFVRAAEVVVIGFFQDSEQPEVSEFLAMVQNIEDVPFGLCNSSNVLSYYNVTKNTISLFREVDNKRQDLEIKESDEIDATKLSRFVRINELRWVTEYNPMSWLGNKNKILIELLVGICTQWMDCVEIGMSQLEQTAIGLFGCTIEIHLLLFTDKSFPKHVERMEKYQEVAKLFQGQILFILVDMNAKGNDKVMSYFHLKRSQLPALAAFHTPDEEQDVLPLDEVSLETVKDFCNGFLQKMQKENLKSEDKDEL